MDKYLKKIILYVGGFIVTVICIYFYYGDNPFQNSLEKGVIINYEQYVNLKKDKSSDGKRVALVGYAIAHSNITYIIGRPIELPFVDSTNKVLEYIPFELKKDGKNSFYIPSEFTEKDLMIYDNNGNPHTYDEKVIVSFTMERIKEAIPEQNPKTGEYVWKCKLIRIDPIEK